MPNVNRDRGDYFERTTRRALEAHGWVVIRAGGSLGPADLWAARNGSTMLMVACKLNGTIPPKERESLRQAAHQAGARPLMATRSKRGWVDLKLVLTGPEAPPVESLKVPPTTETEGPGPGPWDSENPLGKPDSSATPAPPVKPDLGTPA
jgi:Holliday junction resolvase